MQTPTQERRQTVLFRLGLISAVLALLIVLISVGAEMYIRWFINKDFAILSGFELEALTISAFALILGMFYLQRLGTKPV